MKRIATKNAPAALGPYAQAVDAGSTVYCSGQLGLDPATGALAEGVQAQTHQALKNLQAVLGAGQRCQDNGVRAGFGGFRRGERGLRQLFPRRFPRAQLRADRRPAEKRPCGDRVHRGAVKTHCRGGFHIRPETPPRTAWAHIEYAPTA